jgi:hypothetical protein
MAISEAICRCPHKLRATVSTDSSNRAGTLHRVYVHKYPKQTTPRLGIAAALSSTASRFPFSQLEKIAPLVLNFGVSPRGWSLSWRKAFRHDALEFLQSAVPWRVVERCYWSWVPFTDPSGILKLHRIHVGDEISMALRIGKKFAKMQSIAQYRCQAQSPRRRYGTAIFSIKIWIHKP